MNCEEFRNATVSDDPAEQTAAERHAAECPDCAALLRGDAELAAEVERWKRAAPAPAATLEARVARALAEESRVTKGAVLRAVGQITVAASLILAVGYGAYLLKPGPAGPPSIETVLQQADAAREQYVRSIAELERRAVPVLERAADPELDAPRASLLLRYRDRLDHLDSVITEVQDFLDENPGHGGGHTVLLAAYQEKQQVLSDLLQLEIGGRS